MAEEQEQITPQAEVTEEQEADLLSRHKLWHQETHHHLHPHKEEMEQRQTHQLEHLAAVAEALLQILEDLLNREEMVLLIQSQGQIQLLLAVDRVQ
jgi:hypothetical protein